jgi:hypothetical protein
MKDKFTEKALMTNKIIFCGGTGEVSQDSIDKINAFTERSKKHRKEIVSIISDMLDKPDETGIYPTALCYRRLVNYCLEIEGNKR